MLALTPSRGTEGRNFRAVLSDADANLAEEIASRIPEQVEGLCLSSAAKCGVTVSIGIAALWGAKRIDTSGLHRDCGLSFTSGEKVWSQPADQRLSSGQR